MPKASGRYGKHYESEGARLLRQYQAAAAFLDRFTLAAFEGVWRGVRFAVADALADAADDACREGIAAGDEAFFTAYSRLLAAYGTLSSLQAGNDDAPEGIFALAEARLAAGGVLPGHNPIAAEKKAIVMREIKRAAGLLDGLGTQIRAAELPGILTALRDAAEGADDPTDALAERLCTLFTDEADALYGIYTDAACAIWSHLHDLSARPEARRYAALLQAEYTALAAVQPNTAALLDAGDEQRRRAGEAAEAAFTALAADWAALSPLLAAGNMPEAVLLAPEELLGKCLAQAQAFPLPSFREAKEAYAFRAPYVQQTLHAALSARLDDAADSRDGYDTLEECRRLLRTQNELTDEVTDVFRRIHAVYEADKEQLVLAECADITQGVAETLAIKLDSLAESRAAFAADMDALLAQFLTDAAAPALSDAEREAMLADGTRELLDFLRASEKNTRAAAVQGLLDAFARHEPLVKKREALLRLWVRNAEVFRKKRAEFLKAHLLFECSTFEEILHYSVSRLRSASDAAVLAFAAAVDDGAAALPGIFTRHGITLIAPAPHDMFNGREHEVLMAEEHEDFKKGEIIKLMNCGYKQNDTVLLRANVIAAK